MLYIDYLTRNEIQSYIYILHTDSICLVVTSAINQSVCSFTAIYFLSQIEEMLSLAKSMLGDLSGYSRFETDAKDLHSESQQWRKDQFDDWCRDIQSHIEDHNNPLRSDCSVSNVSDDSESSKLQPGLYSSPGVSQCLVACG